MQSSTQGNPEKTYIDSNIWFSYVTEGKYDNDFTKAKLLIEGIIKNKNQQAVISQLVVLEMLNIFRNKVTQRESFKGKLKATQGLETSLLKTINSFSKKFADILTEWENSGKLLIIKVSTPMTDFFREVQSIQKTTTGTIEDVSKCGVCRRLRDSYRYRGVDHYDIQHALIAKSGKVNNFATFDSGYKLLEQNGFLNGMALKLLR